MAALSEVYAPDLVDLREIRADDLNPLLEEEGLAWRTQLSWDFGASADLVRRFGESQRVYDAIVEHHDTDPETVSIEAVIVGPLFTPQSAPRCRSMPTRHRARCEARQ